MSIHYRDIDAVFGVNTVSAPGRSGSRNHEPRKQGWNVAGVY